MFIQNIRLLLQMLLHNLFCKSKKKTEGHKRMHQRLRNHCSKSNHNIFILCTCVQKWIEPKTFVHHRNLSWSGVGNRNVRKLVINKHKKICSVARLGQVAEQICVFQNDCTNYIVITNEKLTKRQGGDKLKTILRSLSLAQWPRFFFFKIL